MNSLWLQTHVPCGSDPLPASCEVVVVGGGITGMTTALLMAQQGRRVCVLEARSVGSGATGHSSAKLSVLQGTKFSRLLQQHPQEVVEGYVAQNHAALDWLLRFCGEHDVPVTRRDAATFARTADERDAVEREHQAATMLGLDVRWTEELEIPFDVHGATVLADQAQIDPMDLMDALVREFRSLGGVVVETARVRHVSWRGDPVVTLETTERISCSEVVLATGSPILDRGALFARLVTMRSYVIALEHPEPPRLMALSAGDPAVSLRDAHGPLGSRLLLVGGHGHVTGRARSESEHVAALRAWTQERFPEAREVARWSAQDHRMTDGLPWVGTLPTGGGRLRAATGFDKWGFTNGVAAALRLTELGEGPPRGSRWRSGPGSLAATVVNNVEVAGAAVVGVARLLRRDAPAGTAAGPCPHLGGPLHWNDAEESWDCPLHGSRFDEDGCVLEGPATRRLAVRRPRAARAGATGRATPTGDGTPGPG